jgi:hypothetical protein
MSTTLRNFYVSTSFALQPRLHNKSGRGIVLTENQGGGGVEGTR